MKDALGAEGREALRAFVDRRTLIALDFDGTLAPIVARPADAAMRQTTRQLLGQVARRHPVLILTGRARADALKLLNGVPVLEIIGSHGLETADAAPPRFARRVGAWRQQVEARLGAAPGIHIEDKRYSLSLHYRDAIDEVAALDRIHEAIRGLDGARVVGGKKVVNLVPAEAPHKGSALLAACRRLGYERAVFVGDDLTDEDVFLQRDPERIFGIHVGAGPSAAEYQLAEQARIDDLLALLAEH